MPGSRGLQRILLVATTIAATAISVCIIQPLTAFDFLAWLFPRIVWRVDTAQPLVALSFDDGPDPRYTPQVLEILARHRANATFFLIGERAAVNPELVERIKSGGHEIGNHYYSRRSTLLHSSSTFADNLARTERILGLTEQRPKLFRPPGGLVRPSQLTIALERGYMAVLGSAYPYDGQRPPTSYVRWLVSKNLAPGVIVILHDASGDRSNTIAALPGILEAGHNKGLRFVTVGELFAAGDRWRLASGAVKATQRGMQHFLYRALLPHGQGPFGSGTGSPAFQVHLGRSPAAFSAPRRVPGVLLLVFVVTGNVVKESYAPYWHLGEHPTRSGPSWVTSVARRGRPAAGATRQLRS